MRRLIYVEKESAVKKKKYFREPKTSFFWFNPKLEVRNTYLLGKGVYTKKLIKKDELLAVFGGDIIQKKDFYKIPRELQKYPFHIHDRLLLGCLNKEELNESEYFNHNCSPNAGFKGQVFLVSMKNIEKNKQITFDYAMCMTSKIVDMKCFCGSKNCRGEIKSSGWKILGLQKKYRGYFQPYIQDKIDKLNKK